MISKEEFAAMQDHSILEPYASKEEILVRIQETIDYKLAAVYINPCWVKFAKGTIGDKCNIGTVIGFPHGANKTNMKIMEGLQVIDDGADELDVVINISWVKSGMFENVKHELEQFVKEMKKKRPDIVIKAIIECCYLNHDEKIKVCKIVANSGADYIKTSTGTGTWGCKVSDIRIMRKIVNGKCKIKAADGIKTIEQALAVISEGATRIGDNSGIQLLAEWDKQLWE